MKFCFWLVNDACDGNEQRCNLFTTNSVVSQLTSAITSRFMLIFSFSLPSIGFNWAAESQTRSQHVNLCLCVPFINQIDPVRETNACHRKLIFIFNANPCLPPIAHSLSWQSNVNPNMQEKDKDSKVSSALKKSSRYRSRSLSASSTDSYSSGKLLFYWRLALYSISSSSCVLLVLFSLAMMMMLSDKNKKSRRFFTKRELIRDNFFYHWGLSCNDMVLIELVNGTVKVTMDWRLCVILLSRFLMIYKVCWTNSFTMREETMRRRKKNPYTISTWCSTWNWGVSFCWASHHEASSSQQCFL